MINHNGEPPRNPSDCEAGGVKHLALSENERDEQIAAAASTPRADSMAAAMEWLTLLNIPYFRASQYQLKILGDLNFYPGRGTINLDNQPRLPWRGLTGLRTVLMRRLRCDLPAVPRLPLAK